MQPVNMPQQPMMAPPAQGSDLASDLAELLALTRAVYEVQQSFHWRTQGPNFLAMHDLFARTYGTTYGYIDGLAEKIIGITGVVDAVDPVAQSIVTAQMIQQLNPAMDSDQFAASAVIAVETLMARIDQVLSRQDLSQGLSNFLQDMSDKHEVSIYLLKQTSAPSMAPKAVLPQQ